MLTFTPVACVNASISLTKASSSDCTKYFQRSMESCAPFSAFHGADCAQALAHSSSAGPVRAPAAAAAVPPFTSVRRVNMVMVPPGWFLRVQSLFRGLVEQMDELRFGLEPDLVARLELMSFAEHRDNVWAVFLATKFRHDLRLRAGWLDHLDDSL